MVSERTAYRTAAVCTTPDRFVVIIIFFWRSKGPGQCRCISLCCLFFFLMIVQLPSHADPNSKCGRFISHSCGACLWLVGASAGLSFAAPLPPRQPNVCTNRRRCHARQPLSPEECIPWQLGCFPIKWAGSSCAGVYLFVKCARHDDSRSLFYLRTRVRNAAGRVPHLLMLTAFATFVRSCKRYEYDSRYAAATTSDIGWCHVGMSQCTFPVPWCAATLLRRGLCGRLHMRSSPMQRTVGQRTLFASLPPLLSSHSFAWPICGCGHALSPPHSVASLSCKPQHGRLIVLLFRMAGWFKAPVKIVCHEIYADTQHVCSLYKAVMIGTSPYDLPNES